MTTRILPRVLLPYFDTDSGDTLVEGDEFTVKGETGQFRFIGHIITPRGEWIDAFGGVSKGGQFRSFRPERIKKKKVSRT